MREQENPFRKILSRTRRQNLSIIVASDHPESRPAREWKCTECGSWTNWPGYPMRPCFHCNMTEDDVGGPLYVPRYGLTNKEEGA